MRGWQRDDGAGMVRVGRVWEQWRQWEGWRTAIGVKVGLERETGFEPATPCLEGRHSTTELLPRAIKNSIIGRGKGSWDCAGNGGGVGGIGLGGLCDTMADAPAVGGVIL